MTDVDFEKAHTRAWDELLASLAALRGRGSAGGAAPGARLPQAIDQDLLAVVHTSLAAMAGLLQQQADHSGSRPVGALARETEQLVERLAALLWPRGSRPER